MENKLEQIKAILSKAETDLRQIIADAALEGDYRSTDTARAVAVNIRDLNERVLDGTLISRSLTPQTKMPVGMSQSKKKVSRKKIDRRGYPKFKLQNDCLVKIGFSRRHHSEYSHKAPKKVFEQTIKAMATLAGRSASPVTAEQIIEQLNSFGTELIPSYQVYLVIALLRDKKCIEQVGKTGYRIASDIVEKASLAWRNLS